MESTSTEDEVHQVGDGSAVLVELAAPSGSGPIEENYDRVTILPSGWIKCTGPRDDTVKDETGDRTAADYYPPDRVIGVFAVEELSEE